MALKITNIGGKIIGIGEITCLPGATNVVPSEYEHSPILENYKSLGMIEITGVPETPVKTETEIANEKAEADKKAAEEAETLRKARLEALPDMTDEEIGKLAVELGVNMSSCKDQADVVKKIKAALKK